MTIYYLQVVGLKISSMLWTLLKAPTSTFTFKDTIKTLS